MSWFLYDFSGLKLEYNGVQLKGSSLIMKEVVAEGHVPTTSGKVSTDI